jgi:predicted extracellular nuclease
MFIAPSALKKTSSFQRHQLPMFLIAILLGSVLLLGLKEIIPTAHASVTAVSINALDTPLTENFDTLASTGTSSVVPNGWAFAETSTNANTTYTAGNGGTNGGDTYSFGNTGSTERAFGGLQSGNLIPTIGASFTNNTSSTITSLAIAYTGEQWRLGATGRADRLDFQYSLDATSLTTGTYTDFDTLDFIAPNSTGTVGALDGNLAANRTAVSSTITSLNILPGSTVFIRWNDFNAAGADDGLGIDDFSLTASGTAGGGTPSLLINDVTQAEGNAGTTTFNFTVSLTGAAPPGGVTFDIATQDGTAIAASGDYVARTLTAQTIPQGMQTYNFAVTVNGDTTTEPNETFTVNVTNVVGANISDGQGVGTITNDDITAIAIHEVQGSGVSSPFAGQSVTVTGIVTGLRTNGFFLQAPDAQADADPNTSEGIFVFTSSAPPAAAAIGNSVSVAGTVQEFIPATDLPSPPATELTTVTVSLFSTGNPLPAPVTITAADTLVNDLNNLEKYEGMRVHVNSLTAVAPTQGTINEASATSTSNGTFYAVVTGVARPFREPGIQVPDPVPTPVPANVPRFDSNPERIRVDSDAQPGAVQINLTTGAVLTNVTGVLDYGFRTYTILPDAATPPTVTANISAIPVPVAAADEFTIGSFNMERFFDTTNDPESDVVLTQTAFDNRLNKASLAIRNVMRTPDVIGIEEMEHLTTLQAVATKVNNDAVAASQPNPNYVAYLSEGNDVGGIDVGFLVKSSRVSVIDVVQFGKDTMYTPPDGGTALLNDRPPLVMRATIPLPGGGTMPLTVIVNHLRSLSGVDDPVDGGRVRFKRRAQAEYLANLIQARQTADPTEKIISVGDYNAFQFNDGFGDSIGTIKGTPTPPDQVLLASPDLVNPDLIDLVDTLPYDQRYSFTFDGNAQTLDHELVNTALYPQFHRLAYARNNGDYPETFRTDPNRPERISDHDMPVAFFGLNATPLVSGNILISEFRLRGATGPTDEFIELYNNTDSTIAVQSGDGSAGWSIASLNPDAQGSTLVATVPNGTVIPPRAHYLVTNNAANGYSLAAAAASDLQYQADIPDNVGIALFRTANAASYALATRLDAVGFNTASSSTADLFREGGGLPVVLTSNEDYSFVRKMSTGLPQDTNDNAADFALVSTRRLTGGFVSSTNSDVLGAPGPEGLSSPVNRNSTIVASLIDPLVSRTASPNFVRNGSGNSGTLTIRRKFTNTTGANVNQLRFRIIDITTFNTPVANPPQQQADFRVISSSDASVGTTMGQVNVKGTTLDQTPPQPSNGGLNSTLSVGSLSVATPLHPGESINVQFLMNVAQSGTFRFFVNVEGMP